MTNSQPQAATETVERATEPTTATKATPSIESQPFSPETAPKLGARQMRDGLSPSLATAAGVSRVRADHLSSLLYGPGTVEAHRAPYNQRYAPHYAEATREDESGTNK